jgi:hypothetical protein
MNLLTRAAILGATVITATAVTAQTATALTVEQSQELNTSSKTSISCNSGDCSGSAEATSNGKQNQRVEAAPTGYKAGKATYRKGKALWMPATVVMMDDGQVRLNWGMRGGTCHVRYSEANQSAWKYQTSASCDEGGVTIGGLQSGVKYKFQVRQDNGAWSKIMVGKAE